ncbi:hypothetical protein B5M42_007180 [Paenibacillus athensensis]|uniref:Uncharacterized protein n=1 Tax=Paenibacillus athensensis TaxID=1967502 RepID=A0A4Y8PSP3_9BACL|nr:hypothetical protein [Paenibacillus athensensis]MCD1258614.1 hypothetical protein [Paenibacillus athensensis]
MQRYKATLLFDLDDVLADFLTALLNEYNGRYNDRLTLDDVTEWDLSRSVKPECGRRVYDLFQTPGLFRQLSPKPHAADVLQRLSSRGFEIVIVSDSPPGHAYCDYRQDASRVSNPTDDKRKWLREHLPMVDPHNLIITGQKWRVAGDLLIDDKPETYETFVSLGSRCLLMDQPYNRHVAGALRARDLLEAEATILALFGD